EDAGEDEVDLDIFVRVIQRQRAGEVDHARLAGGVHVVVSHRADAHARGDVDDLAATLADHVGEDGAATVERAGDVQVDAGAPLLVGERFHGLVPSRRGAPGVVDQNIDPPELGEGRRHQRVDRGGVGDVGLHGQTATAFGSHQCGSFFNLRPG